MAGKNKNKKIKKKSKRKSLKNKTTKSRSQRIKTRARKSLKGKKISKRKKKYVVDTSAIINKVLPKSIKKGLKGRIIVPNAVMAEIENLANKGREEGFIGLEEISKLHSRKKITLLFKGKRPSEKQIRYAKSGEIDAMIREIARKNKATLITADLVQAKSTQAYGINVLFFKVKRKPKKKKKKKGFFKRIFK